MKIHLFDRDAQTESFPAQHTLFAEGDSGQQMFAVVEGAVDIVIRGTRVETVEAGGVFGEMALIEDRPRNATAIVKDQARLVAIDRKRFLFLVQQNPYFSLQLMSVMAERLRRMDDRL